MITYRTAGDWGAGKGGNLTPAEVDENFWWVYEQILDLGDGPAPAEIDTITFDGNQLTITLTDTRSFGPYNIPSAAFLSRGEWAATTAYDANDLVDVPADGLYLVLKTHTSPSAFDAAHEVSGDPAYQLVYQDPRPNVFTASGTTFAPLITHIWGYVRATNAAGCAVTVPTNASVAFPIGSEIRFCQRGAAPVTIVGDTGVTVNKPSGYDAETSAVGRVVTLKKIATNEWDLFGDLAVT
ncbi:MAG: hypothetical protein V4747_11510 [Pseudomonadota bacterium]